MTPTLIASVRSMRYMFLHGRPLRLSERGYSSLYCVDFDSRMKNTFCPVQSDLRSNGIHALVMRL